MEKTVTLIIYRKHGETEIFYCVPQDEVKWFHDRWHDYINPKRIAVFENGIFHSDQGETSILYSEVAGMSIKETDNV